MGKEQKTNAMRILDRAKVAYEVNTYECDEFIDGCHIADQLGQRYDESFKTLVTKGKSGGYFVFALPVDKELDLKAAEVARELGGRCVLVACGHQMPDRLTAAGCPVAATLADAVRLASASPS